MPDNWLLNQNNPKAYQAIILGRLAADQQKELAQSHYKQLLWFTDEQGAAQWAKHQQPPAVTVVDIAKIPPNQLHPLIEGFILQDALEMPDVKVSAATQDNGDAYSVIIDQCTILLDQILRARLTRREEGALWTCNAFANLKAYCQHRIGPEAANAFAGKTVAVVGAGPSLDTTLPLLKSMRANCVIIAADSALYALQQNGIEPDCTISTDATKPPEKCLPQDFDAGTLILSLISHKGWTQLPNKSIFIAANILTADWLEANGIDKPATGSLANCGISAVKLALWAKAERILLFGMDMASDPNDASKRHAEGTDETLSRGAQYKVDGQQQSVPGNYHEQVPTFMLHEYHQLNQLLQSASGDTPIFNINDSGAKLQVARCIHPAQLPNDILAAIQKNEAGDVTLPTVSEAFKADRLLPAIEKIFAAVRELDSPAVSPKDAHRLLTDVVRDDQTGRALGTFTLKAMPYLLYPDRVDHKIYSTLTHDLLCIVKAMKAVGLESPLQ